MGGAQTPHLHENMVPYAVTKRLQALGGGNYIHRLGWSTTKGSRAASHGYSREMASSSSAAEVESQDPDSTNTLESEVSRDYFLKCKFPACCYQGSSV